MSTVRYSQSGFTLIETIVSSIILSSLMLGMMGILASYSKTANKSQDITMATNLAQQEIDIILADMKVQQSLASRDKTGRAGRDYIYLKDGSFRGYINHYFFWNFKEINHDRPEDEIPPTLGTVHGFRVEDGNRFYDEFGSYLGSSPNTDPHVADPFSSPPAMYVTRIEIFGIPSNLDDASIQAIEETKEGDAYKYQMADTDLGISNQSLEDTYPLRKILVVKVYRYQDYLKNNANLGGATDTLERRVLAKMKIVVNGGA